MLLFANHAQTPGSPANLPRAATPNLPTEAASPESTAVDEISLQQFSTAIIDIKAMDAEVVKLWREELSVMMPESIDDGSDENIGPEGASAPLCMEYGLTSHSRHPQAYAVETYLFNSSPFQSDHNHSVPPFLRSPPIHALHSISI